MLKIEFIWRELLYRAIETGNPAFTITDLSQKFRLSTSVVSHALLPLRELRAVEIGKIRSRVIDSEKLLYFWATRRNLNKDIIYKTHSHLPIMEIETLMPPFVYPTSYSAFRLYYGNPPADYQKVYFYTCNPQEVQKRFPSTKTENPNLYILIQDPYLSLYKTTPLAQIFADLWNMTDWYAREFTDKLVVEIKNRIGL